MGPSRDSGVQRDPADVSTHDFCHHAPRVSVSRRTQSIHRVSRDTHRRIETEGEVSSIEVVVDGLRDPNNRNPTI